MTKRNVGYWFTTIITALAFLMGGVVYLARVDAPLKGMAELGYPPYFVTILGTFKLLGAIAILAPRFPRLKEWAYAGIAFDLIGAAWSYVALAQPEHVTAPLVMLVIAAASWALRPPSRVIGPPIV